MGGVTCLGGSCLPPFPGSSLSKLRVLPRKREPCGDHAADLSACSLEAGESVGLAINAPRAPCRSPGGLAGRRRAAGDMNERDVAAGWMWLAASWSVRAAWPSALTGNVDLSIVSLASRHGGESK